MIQVSRRPPCYATMAVPLLHASFDGSLHFELGLLEMYDGIPMSVTNLVKAIYRAIKSVR